jgi:hypothetical protein
MTWGYPFQKSCDMNCDNQLTKGSFWISCFCSFFVWHTMEVYNGRWSFVCIVYIHSAYHFINLLGYEEHETWAYAIGIWSEYIHHGYFNTPGCAWCQKLDCRLSIHTGGWSSRPFSYIGWYIYIYVCIKIYIYWLIYVYI